MPSPSNLAILATAGARKTEHVINEALNTNGRVLLVTFTRENQAEIVDRIVRKVGLVPPNIMVTGWFSFLINECVKPYQRAITGRPFVVQGLNFDGERLKNVKKDDPRFFIDRGGNVYRRSASDLVVQLNVATDGAVIRRLERVFARILIDEVQDLSGYDLDVLDLLFASNVDVTVVGDLRQHILDTHNENRNQKYRGMGLLRWFEERTSVCGVVHWTESYRCAQSICDFADALFPEMPSTTSVGVAETGHDGIVLVSRAAVAEYVATHRPQVLRHSRASDTLGLDAMNIGVAKGRTFDRVLIFPTKPMRDYLKHRDHSKLKDPHRFYVAVTRARWSVAFVVD